MGAGALSRAGPTPPAAQEPVPDDLVRYLDEVEPRDPRAARSSARTSNRTAAGASLGLSLRQMRYRMARLGITESETSRSDLMSATPCHGEAPERTSGTGRLVAPTPRRVPASPNFQGASRRAQARRHRGAALDQPAAGPIRRRRHRGGCVHRTRWDWAAHPYFETESIRRARGVGPFRGAARRCTVLQFVSIDDRAWHAGRSSWDGREAANDWSVGIELEGLEEAARRSSPRSTRRAREAPAARHRPRAVRSPTGRRPRARIAPGRKVDPQVVGFDWADLASRPALGCASASRPRRPAARPIA